MMVRAYRGAGQTALKIKKSKKSREAQKSRSKKLLRSTEIYKCRINKTCI